MKVLCVCFANVNRSPRAARTLLKIVRERGIEDVEVSSAGTEAWRVKDADKMEKRYGIRSTTQVTTEMLLDADIIVALDGSVAWDLVNVFGAPQSKVANLTIPDNFTKLKGNIDTLDMLLERELPKVLDFLRE